MRPPTPLSAAGASAPVQCAKDTHRAGLSDLLSSGSGQKLPSDVSNQASRGLGGSFNDVSIHTGPKASSVMSGMGLKAATVGNNIVFGGGSYKPQSDSGRFVIMHELAHVKQQRGQEASLQALDMGADSDEAEVDASAAAMTVLSGGTWDVASVPAKIRGFGATAGGDPEAIAHENQTVDAALNAGLTEEQAKVMYSGNWHQDMNQMLMPASEMFAPQIYSILDIAHLKHFGFPIPSPEVFGTYDPIGHLDNPGGIVGSGIYKQADSSGLPVDMDMAGITSSGETLAGGDEGYAKADPRYKRAFDDMKSKGTKILNPSDIPAFQVDESGIPVYLKSSKQQLKDRLAQAAMEGGDTGNVKKKDGGRGLMYAGEALHIMQDYYAHSNFCEIAINMLLDSSVNARGELVDHGDPAAIQSFMESMDIEAGEFYLNTGIQAVDETGAPVPGNLTFAGRQVMATGTFTLEDTAHSIKEKVLAALSELNPFSPSAAAGPSEWTVAVLDWMQSNPDFVPSMGDWVEKFANTLNGAIPFIETTIDGISWAQQGLGVVEEFAELGMGEAARLFHKAKGFFSGLFGGNRKAEDEAADRARQQAQARAEAARQERAAAAAAAQESKGRIVEAIKAFNREDGLSSLYKVAYEDFKPLVSIATWVKLIPIVGPKIYEYVKKLEGELKEWARGKLEKVWLYTAQKVAEGVKAGVELGTGDDTRLGVADPTTSMFMTQPTHTDVAKDFDPAEHAHSENITLGEIFGIEQTIESIEHTLGFEHEDPNEHKHEHRHEGAWLAPLAHTMATNSSTAIVKKLNACWAGGSEAMKGNIDTMHGEVDKWFAHPADCQGTWVPAFSAAFQANVTMGNEHSLKAELSRRTHLPPSAQTGHSAKVNKEEDHGHDHDHDHDH